MARVIAEARAGAILMFNPVMARPHHPSSVIFPTFGFEPAFSSEELERFDQLSIPECMWTFFAKSLQKAEAARFEPGSAFLRSRDWFWLDQTGKPPTLAGLKNHSCQGLSDLFRCLSEALCGQYSGRRGI